MSGIPVYTQIKPSGVTPQTATPAPQTQDPSRGPFSAEATTTLTSTSTYPSARPGDSAFPAPTGNAAQRYAPVNPTPTTQGESEGPPPPQPGAVPTPLSRSNIPPPPKAGEKYRPQQTGSAQVSSPMPQPYPPQMSVPPPMTAAYGQPTYSTSTSNTPPSAYPVPLPSSDDGAKRSSLEHPPGYHQNVYASELTSEQRRAQEANNASGFGVRDRTGKVGGTESDSMWDTAKKWAQDAGAKIAEAEDSVWRKINKE
ncbi:hypothetical protein G7Y89_g9841 [Cudoniella acicularis]|uniref:Uncharacterized protein n=1 Tax=Cudoniella acicularis TaxID=354080 RepID=A0A8H4RGK9_9HELO|nr:hypothetical protein G7Y89_g9841 [Cudoniella acicularis]